MNIKYNKYIIVDDNTRIWLLTSSSSFTLAPWDNNNETHEEWPPEDASIKDVGRV